MPLSDYQLNESPEQFDFDAAAIARAGDYANLPVPESGAEHTQQFVDKWVKPFYLTNLVERYDEFETNFQAISKGIDDDLIFQLLCERNWRPRIVAGYFAAILQLDKHTVDIGNLLLRSDVCFAGGGYALALARINTPLSIEYLTKYLDHYLRRPDLQFDQADVLGALHHCDKLNGTDRTQDYVQLWDEYTSGYESPRPIPKAVEWFGLKMKSILKLSAIVG